MTEDRVMGSIVFADGRRWTCRVNRPRVIITWPASGIEVDAGRPDVRDAETGDRLPVAELNVAWNSTGLMMAGAVMQGEDWVTPLTVEAMRIDPGPGALSHACPECGMRRDYRLEPTDGGKPFRPGVPLRRRWTCIAGHVQVENETPQ